MWCVVDPILAVNMAKQGRSGPVRGVICVPNYASQLAWGLHVSCITVLGIARLTKKGGRCL